MDDLDAKRIGCPAHFIQRCKERGLPDVDHVALARVIQKAVLENDAHCEFVCQAKHGSSVYRFSMFKQMRYVICKKDGMPVTLITKKILRKIKYNNKCKRKGVSPFRPLRVRESRGLKEI